MCTCVLFSFNSAFCLVSLCSIIAAIYYLRIKMVSNSLNYRMFAQVRDGGGKDAVQLDVHLPVPVFKGT